MLRAFLIAAVAALAAATVAASRPGATCSAAKLSTKLAKEPIPAAVAKTRQRIVNAAVACDYTKLEKIGNEQDGLKFSYGMEKSAADYWRAEEKRGAKPMAMLVKLLRLPVTHGDAKTYSWPPAYTEKPTKADWDQLVRAGILTQKQADAQRKNGNVYYGYRTAILKSGDWSFFVQGD